MKLSEDTLSILKNFSALNPGIEVKEGNLLRTISKDRTVLAEAKVTETFEVPFRVFDLSSFLGALSLLEGSNLNFQDKFVTISDENTSIKFVYAAENTVVVPPEKMIALPSEDIKFKLPQETFVKLQKAVSVLGVPEIIVTFEDGVVFVKASDSKNPTSNEYKIKVGEHSNAFSMIFKAIYIANLVPADYDITISKKKLASFKSNTIEYWIVAESHSIYVE